jgi:hypothetical protein
MKTFITTVFLMCTVCAFGLRADINGDGRVDMEDLAILASEWMQEDEPMFGPNLVTNGTFDTDLSGWTAENGWSWSSYIVAEVEWAITEGVTAILSQALPIVAGKQYEISWDVVNNIDVGAGTFSIALGGTVQELGFEEWTASGHQSYMLTAGTTDNLLKFTGVGQSSLKILGIDNISVRELLTNPDSLANQSGNSLANPAGNSLAHARDNKLSNGSEV